MFQTMMPSYIFIRESTYSLAKKNLLCIGKNYLFIVDKFNLILKNVYIYKNASYEVSKNISYP
jgi:hypothetical protein